MHDGLLWLALILNVVGFPMNGGLLLAGCPYNRGWSGFFVATGAAGSVWSASMLVG